MKDTRAKILANYSLISDYIIVSFSDIDVSRDCSMLESNFAHDIAKFNFIVGKMDSYLSGKVDFENFDYMVDWFKNELSDRNYSLKDFETFIENKNAEIDE